MLDECQAAFWRANDDDDVRHRVTGAGEATPAAMYRVWRGNSMQSSASALGRLVGVPKAVELIDKPSSRW